MKKLDELLSTIQNTIDRVNQNIDLLREYRTRLISDVVTGKLDVRGVELASIAEIESAGPEAGMERLAEDEPEEESELDPEEIVDAAD